MGNVSTASVFSNLDASICAGTLRAVPILERQSEINKMRTISVRSAGPLISKFRKSEFARKRSRVSSIMSATFESPKGAGPRILVLIGKIAMFPTRRTSGNSLKEEWYAGIVEAQI